jgi:acetolactate synthase-1/2/3 large subunit
MISGARAIIESLKREGVNHIFSLPGKGTLDLFDAIYDDSDIKLIVCRHEQGAAFMADGFTRASVKPAVCMASRSSGALNMATVVQNAYQESSPLICLFGQVEQGITERDAFEEMDLVAGFRPFTKWAVEIQKVERIPEIVQRAVRTALIGRPRPVMISVPWDLQQVNIEPSFLPSTNLPKRRPDKKDLEEAVRLLIGSKRPVILAGGGVTRAGANDELRKFAEFLNIPVITTWLKNDVFPNEHPLYLGTLGYGAPKLVYDFFESADLVLAVGCRFSEHTTRRYSFLKPDAAIININIDDEGLNQIFSPAVGIASDAKLALLDLIATVQEALPGNELEKIRLTFIKGVSKAREALARVTTIASGQYKGNFVHQGILLQNIQKMLSKDSIITMDSGAHGAWVSPFYKFSHPGTFFAPGGGSMGFGFPAALGVKLAQPERTVVSITGDGGFMMVLQELETAVRYKIPVIVVVINGFGFANIKEWQLKKYGGREIGNDFSNPDYAQLAKLFGANGERIEKEEDIVPAMKRALSSEMPTVLDVIVDPDLILPPLS